MSDSKSQSEEKVETMLGEVRANLRTIKDNAEKEYLRESFATGILQKCKTLEDKLNSYFTTPPLISTLGIIDKERYYLSCEDFLSKKCTMFRKYGFSSGNILESQTPYNRKHMDSDLATFITELDAFSLKAARTCTYVGLIIEEEKAERVKQIKELQGKILTEEQSHHFGQQAIYNIWFMGIFCVLAIFIGCVLYSLILGDLDPMNGVQGDDPDKYIKLLSKVFFGSVLIAVLYNLVGMLKASYNAHLNNRHKQNALGTVPPLIDAAKGRDVSDDVLREAARSIFERPETGLVAQSGESSGDGPHNMVFNQIPKGWDKRE